MKSQVALWQSALSEPLPKCIVSAVGLPTWAVDVYFRRKILKTIIFEYIDQFAKVRIGLPYVKL